MQFGPDMTTVKKIIKAGQLPRDWAGKFADPDQPVRVTITEVDPELDNAASLSKVMDLIGARAQKRGLTPDIVNDILHER